MNKADIFEDVKNEVMDYFTSLSAPEQYTIGLIIITAIFFVILERLSPYTKCQRILRDGFFDDFIFYNIAQTYILGLLILGYMIIFADKSTDFSRLHLFSETLSHADPLCFQKF